jgi:hypothetical protein
MRERGLKRFVCPCCGLAVIGDEAAQTFHHARPLCDGFQAKVKEFGLKAERVEPIAFVDVDPKDLPS